MQNSVAKGGCGSFFSCANQDMCVFLVACFFDKTKSMRGGETAAETTKRPFLACFFGGDGNNKSHIHTINTQQ